MSIGRLFFLLGALLLAASPAFAQDRADVVANCGTPNSTYSAGQPAPMTQNTAGQGCQAVAIVPSPTGGLTPVHSAALEATHVLKNAAGVLYSAYASNLTGGASGFLVLYNATAAPAPGALTGALVMDCVPFNALGTAVVSYGGLPSETYSAGITALVTSATTCFTYTTGTLTAYIHGMVQ